MPHVKTNEGFGEPSNRARRRFSRFVQARRQKKAAPAEGRL
jgi:hypothetical protein